MTACAKCGKELTEGATFCATCGAPVGAAPSATAQPSAPSQPSAPVSGVDALIKDQKAQEYWIWRAVAILVDWVAVYIVLGVLTVIVAFPSFLVGGGVLFASVFGELALLWGVMFVLYFSVAEAKWGESLGKHIFSLRVKSKSESNPTFGEAFVRNNSKIYWLLLLLDVIVGLATSKGYEQKYSDHLMGTTVVHV